jgi:hypothetical protein
MRVASETKAGSTIQRGKGIAMGTLIHTHQNLGKKRSQP